MRKWCLRQIKKESSSNWKPWPFLQPGSCHHIHPYFLLAQIKCRCSPATVSSLCGSTYRHLTVTHLKMTRNWLMLLDMFESRWFFSKLDHACEYEFTLTDLWLGLDSFLLWQFRSNFEYWISGMILIFSRELEFHFYCPMSNLFQFLHFFLHGLLLLCPRYAMWCSLQ